MVRYLNKNLIIVILFMFTGCMMQEQSKRKRRSAESNISNEGNNNVPGGSFAKVDDSCVSQDNEAVICGQLLAADGVTPVVGAAISMITKSGAKSKLKNTNGKGLGLGNDCISNSNGRFSCSGIYDNGKTKIKIEKDRVADKTIEIDVQVGRKREIPRNTTTISRTESIGKWLVIPGEYDGVQLLLSQLKGCILKGSPESPNEMRGSLDCHTSGLDVTPINQIDSTLSNLEILKQYDFIFINCPTDVSKHSITIQNYVNQGGHIYYSDWASSGLDSAFPGHIEFGHATTDKGISQGHISHDGLENFINNDNFTIYFDLGLWIPIDYVTNDVNVYVWSNTSKLGGQMNAPITVGFKEGEGGCVFFTSYHIEGASTGAKQELVLKYLLYNLNETCRGEQLELSYSYNDESFGIDEAEIEDEVDFDIF